MIDRTRNLSFGRRTLRLSLLLTCSFLLCFFGFTDSQAYGQVSKIEGTCFGPIRWHVLVPKIKDDNKVEELKQAIDQRLKEINDRMSTYKKDSELSLFNQSPSLDWFPVSNETAIVVAKALEISRKTDGAFDITVAPLVSAWNFGAGKKSGEFQPPAKDHIEKILSRIGYQNLEVRLTPPAIKKAKPELQLDLSAIAKGYAVDEVARVVGESGAKNYFVQVGEEVLAKGRHPAGRDWICGIEKPVVGEQVVDIQVGLKDQAIATSGDYRQFYEFEGKRFSHAIDPKTGFPTESGISLVSVAAKDCMTADALATAIMVGGPKVADSFDVGVRTVKFIGSPGELAFQTEQNSSYPKPKKKSAPAGRSFLTTIGVTVLAFGLFLLLMSVGVMFAGKPIKGSCGGLSSMPGNEGKSACDLCRAPSEECKKRLEEEALKAAEGVES